MISYHLPSFVELIKNILIVYYCEHEDCKEILKIDSLVDIQLMLNIYFAKESNKAPMVYIYFNPDFFPYRGYIKIFEDTHILYSVH